MIKDHLTYIPKKFHFVLMFIAGAGASFVFWAGNEFIPFYAVFLFILMIIYRCLGKKYISVSPDVYGIQYKKIRKNPIFSVIVCISGFISGAVIVYFVLLILFLSNWQAIG